MVLQFTDASLDARATVSDDRQHITRTLLFSEGQKKILGLVLPCDGGTQLMLKTQDGAARFEITAGECEISYPHSADRHAATITDGAQNNAADANLSAASGQFYRDGQSVLLPSKTEFVLKTAGVLQYVWHLEG